MSPIFYALFTVFLGGMGQGIVSPQLPKLVSDQNLLALDSGLSATFLYLGIFLSTFWYGKRVDRGGVKILLALGQVAYATTLLGLGVFLGTRSLFILRFLEGISICAIYVSADYLLGRLSTPESRGRVLSYYGIALSLGLLAGPAFNLLSLLYGLDSFFSMRALALVIFLSAGFSLFLSIPDLEKVYSDLPKLGSGPLYLARVYGFLESSLVAILPVLAVKIFKVQPELMLITIILCAALLSYPLGIWIDRISAKRVSLILCFVLALGASAFAFFAGSESLIFLFLLCFFFGFLAAGFYPAGFVWLLEKIGPEHYGYASGAFSRAYGLGSLLGPLGVGAAVHFYGALGFYFSLALLGGIGVFLVSKHGK